ncbi:MAG: acyltransferase [Prevotella sp.]|nr:acyltransferase [Prevotella sp.]
MDRIEFKKEGYDPQIDYIKGLCILFVVWTHCMNRGELSIILFPYWGDTAVPIFIIIQVFHYYKKGVSVRMPSIPKLWKRILQPYIKMIALMFIAQFFMYYDMTDGTFSPTLYWEKRGPGSYYIFIYIEMAFVIPLFAPLYRKFSTKWLLVIFLILSQLVEIVCSLTHCPDNIYRITFFRYIFLIFIGYLLATKGLKLNKLTITAGIFSMLFIYFFAYSMCDMEPVFCTSLVLWPLCHWICYLYIAYFFLPFLKYTYTKLIICNRFMSCINTIGKYSYEIYLFQIFYYATISIYIGKALSIIENHPLQRILYIVISTNICILPTIYLSMRRKLLKSR